jgi:hypothetical protein
MNRRLKVTCDFTIESRVLSRFTPSSFLRGSFPHITIKRGDGLKDLRLTLCKCQASDTLVNYMVSFMLISRTSLTWILKPSWVETFMAIECPSPQTLPHLFLHLLS